MRLERIAWSGPGAPREAELEARLTREGFDPSPWSDSPGQRYAPHRHDHDECLWLVRGRMTFVIDERRHVLGPGDRLMLPAGTVHAALAGPEGATYLIGRRAPAARRKSE